MKFTIRPLSLSLLLACAATGTQALAEQQRLALVIGNAAYAEKALDFLPNCLFCGIYLSLPSLQPLSHWERGFFGFKH